MFDLFGYWNRRARQREARDEVLALLRRHPVEGYGLYLILDDAGLLSRRARRELAPLVARVEARLAHPEDARVALPLPFPPVTDAEYDTLTARIGERLRALAKAWPTLSPTDRLHRLADAVDLLEAHASDTARLAFEVSLSEVLRPVLYHSSVRVRHPRRGTATEVRPGDFFCLERPQSLRHRLPTDFVRERNVPPQGVVYVERVLEGGYALARLLDGPARYRKTWTFGGPDSPLSGVSRRPVTVARTHALVHRAEGRFYRLDAALEGSVLRFIVAYEQHLADCSPDPSIYRPLPAGGKPPM